MKIPTPSIDAYLVEEKSQQISSRSDLKVFLNKKNKKKTSSDTLYDMR